MSSRCVPQHPDPWACPPVPPDRRLLRCGGCGWAVECVAADEPRFLKAGCIVCRAPVRPEPPAEPPAPPPRRNHRLCRRRPPRSGVRVECRRGALGLGPNLAAGLLDVSEGGAGVRLTAPAGIGEEVEVVLARPGGGRPVRGLGDVRWCQPAADGTYRAGVRLRRRLTHADLLDLCR